MASISPVLPDPTASPLPLRETLRVWGLHLLCFVLPGTTFAFVVSGPHEKALGAWLLPLVLSLLVDRLGPSEQRQPAKALPGWPFDGVLYALTALQIANVVLAARLIGITGFFDWHTPVALLLVGVNSGYSGIVVAHELIHRREAHWRFLGRVLMGLVLYEHFTTEHVRGPHVRVGTDEDPATARFGESFAVFFRRTVPGQWRSAWRLETRRLGDPNMRLTDPRLLRSRVVQGFVAQWAFAFMLAAAFGWSAFFFHLLQAQVAIRLLECVNYFEHWGIVRRGKRVDPIDSWDAESWFTLYTLVGLSRHADHHAFATRPYQQLRHMAQSPKLPRGYFGMVMLAIFHNRKYQQLMTAELRRCRLGPFAEHPPAASAS
jgi:alkane 1-monooxygenase